MQLIKSVITPFLDPITQIINTHCCSAFLGSYLWLLFLIIFTHHKLFIFLVIVATIA